MLVSLSNQVGGYLYAVFVQSWNGWIILGFLGQALFTMRVSPASSSRRGRDEEQGVAQLLRQDNQLLVCSYLLRTTAQY